MLSLERLEQARREAENVRHGCLGAAGAELLECLLERVVVGDPGRSLDHLAEGPVRDTLSVRERATRQDARALDPVDELPGEATLPDARLSEDGEEVRPSVSDRARERVLEELQLRFPAHEG